MSITLETAGLDRSQPIDTFVRLNPIYCKESEKLKEVVNKILETGHRSFPVVSQKNLIVGVITIMDLLGAYLRKQDLNDPISAIMSRDVIYVNADDAIGFVLQKFKLTRRGRFPILKDKKVVGIVTERDFVKHFSNMNFEMPVEEVMTKKPFFIRSSITVLDCLKSMVNTRYRRLPVVLDRKLVGVETVTDILRYIKNNDYNFASLMEPLEAIVIRDVLYISEESDISDAIKIMKSKDIGGLPVVKEKNILEGFITERDILEKIE